VEAQVLHPPREEVEGGDEQVDGAADAPPAASLTLLTPCSKKKENLIRNPCQPNAKGKKSILSLILV
jgi:hypothetical protein